MKFDELSSLTSASEMIGLQRSLPCEHFPKRRKFAQSYACLFGTTYKFKQSFSFMKILKNKLRSRSSHSSLKDCLLLSVTNLTPDITGLVKAKQSQSHIEVIYLFCLCIKLYLFKPLIVFIYYYQYFLKLIDQLKLKRAV